MNVCNCLFPCRVDTTRSQLGKVFAKDMREEEEAEVRAYLDHVESTRNQVFGELSGPHLFGEFSLADIMVAPMLPMVMKSKKSALNLSQHPHTRKARFTWTYSMELDSFCYLCWSG